MKPYFRFPPALLSFLWILLLLGCQQTAEKKEEVIAVSPTGYHRVIAIKDGDTIELLKDGQPLRVRLYGIDAPEKNQDFGTRARQFISELCFGKDVRLEVKDIDRYGRTVGIIYLPDGRNLNYEMVKNGFAWHYKAYSKDPELGRLEEEARLDKRGLWDWPSPLAPWEFRNNRKAQSAANKQQKEVHSNDVERSASAGAAVYLCESKGATTYHLDRGCRALVTCKSKIIRTTYEVAGNRNRKACRICAI
ncbi:thermonuclease family protein [Rufibacter sp. DG15C]|uniref:thermonuclease family protein n=1 Tax=Rufibacter sp. DG15C TaxID=1379909 RepID=UPI00082C878A|nr:thermonuclease family protein [Rufibacter sp. DG15C]